jgi:hypothetical protein
MKNSNSPLHTRNGDRRSSLDRRWIRTRYQGEERRSGKDRRSEVELKDLNRDLPAPENAETKKMEGFEKLLVSNTIQLEAVTRLLLEKGILKQDELLAKMKAVQAEYQSNMKPGP